MPRAALTPCSKAGCGSLTSGRFCSAHAQSRHEGRGSARARGYGSTWDRLSIRWRRAHPLCQACESAGRITAADLVDHIVPVHVAPDRVHDLDNLQGLCRSCHADKTAADMVQYGSATTHRTAALRACKTS